MKCIFCQEGEVQKLRNGTAREHLVCSKCGRLGTYGTFKVVDRANCGRAKTVEDSNLIYRYHFNDATDTSRALAVTGHQFNDGVCVVNVWICRFGFWLKLIPEFSYDRQIDLEMLVSACMRWSRDELQQKWARADFRWEHALATLIKQIQQQIAA